MGIVGTLRRHGVGFKSLHEALDTTTPGGRLVFHVFAALAEFIRELIIEGTREGLDAARAPRRAPRPAPGPDGRADPARPRPADPAGQHRLLHRPAAGVNRTASRSPSPASRRGGQDMSAVTPPVDA